MASRGRIVNTEQGWAVTLPAGWLRVDYDGEFGELIRSAFQFDPATVELCSAPEVLDFDACVDEQIAAFEANLDVLKAAGAELGMDMASLSAPLPSMVIIQAVPIGPGDADQLFETGDEGLREAGVTGPIAKERLTLPAGEAVRFSYRWPDPSYPNSRAHQYGVPSGGVGYQVLVLGHRSNNALLADNASDIANSLEILPGS